MQFVQRWGARPCARPDQSPQAPQEWSDPDQPGRISEPEPGNLRQRDAAAPGTGTGHPHARTATRKAASAAVIAPARTTVARTRLCLRVTRWMCAGAALFGMGGGMGYWLSGRRPDLAPLPPLVNASDQNTVPVLHLDGSEAKAGIPGDILTQHFAPEARPMSEGIAPAGPFIGTQTLVEAVEVALTANRYEAIEALALQLGGGWSRDGLPPSAVERLVTAYQASSHWHEVDSMLKFMQGMVMAIGPGRIGDRQLEHLLKVWRWQDDEARRDPDPSLSAEVARGRRTYIHLMGQALEGPSMTEPQLRRLVGTVCEEPEDIAHMIISDPVIGAEAANTADALIYVMYAINQPPLTSRNGARVQLLPASIRRAVQQFLRLPIKDDRWKPVVLMSLHQQPPQTPKGDLVAEDQWKLAVFDLIREHLAETYPRLGPVTNIQEAATALYDPALVQSGILLGIK